MKYVRLQYIGKKPSLHLTMARLTAEYAFEKGNEMTAPVEYDDAAYLLQTNKDIFMVVGGPFESESEPTVKDQEEQSGPDPSIMEKFPGGDKESGAFVGDNTRDERSIPAIKEAEKTPAPDEPKASVKKGKK